jgi:hypothetical protein
MPQNRINDTITHVTLNIINGVVMFAQMTTFPSCKIALTIVLGPQTTMLYEGLTCDEDMIGSLSLQI